jgi:hypothetical protein
MSDIQPVILPNLPKQSKLAFATNEAFMCCALFLLVSLLICVTNIILHVALVSGACQFYDALCHVRHQVHAITPGSGKFSHQLWE